MLIIRKAEPAESELLTNIAIQSEAYWNFDFEYMEKFKLIYKITEKFIRNDPTYILEEEQAVIGFYSLVTTQSYNSLEYLYIAPLYIGQGYGKKLWAHMVDTCKKLNIRSFEIITSPEAGDFYLKMGAIQTGEIESLVRKGRIIPKFVFNVER